MHRAPLTIALWLAIGLPAGCGSDGPRPPAPLDSSPRHLLLVTLSGVRADHTSAYQYPRPTTAWPTDGAQRVLGRALALDDLAEEGLLCAEAWTPAEDPLSALKALFLGRGTPFGEVISGFAPEPGALAERLRDAGFRTAAFVTGPELAVAGGFDQGFDRFEHRGTDAGCLRWALRWLQELDLGDGRPLFLWIHLTGAQPPWEPGSAPPVPGPAADDLDYVALVLAGDDDPEIPRLDFGALYPRPQGASTGAPAPVLDRYDGEVAELASRLRSFLLAYRTLGQPSALFEDTAVVVAGIAGAELGEHGWSHSLYAPAARVPLLFHHPPTVRGRRISTALVSLTDVAPTVLHWLGLEGPRLAEPRRGRSLVGLLGGGERPPDRPVVTVGRGGVQRASLRDGRYTLIWALGEDGEQAELYDRGLDPLELHDVAAQRSRLAGELRDQLVWLLTEVQP